MRSPEVSGRIGTADAEDTRSDSRLHLPHLGTRDLMHLNSSCLFATPLGAITAVARLRLV